MTITVKFDNKCDNKVNKKCCLLAETFMKFHISIPKSFNNNIYHLISIGNIAIIFNYPYSHNYLIKLHDLSIKLHQPESLPRIIFNI